MARIGALNCSLGVKNLDRNRDPPALHEPDKAQANHVNVGLLVVASFLGVIAIQSQKLIIRGSHSQHLI